MKADMDLYLSDIWQPSDVAAFKVHFARWNGTRQPLNALARSQEEWRSWQEYYPGRNDFSRPYIFSLAQIPGDSDLWMFGGIWTVDGLISDERGGQKYQVSRADELQAMIGRLVLHRQYRQRQTRGNFENHFPEFAVHEIRAEAFTGRDFPGFDKVHLSFEELETLVAHNRVDWLTALSTIKGVYLITDTVSQKRYVGSAYGDQGIWERWKVYLRLGHGGNVDMAKLLEGHDLDYCRRNFRFALLEHMDQRIEDRRIIERESYWKNVLDTRNSETGLNRN